MRLSFSTSVPLLLLPLSHLSRVQLCETPQMAAHWDPRPWDSPGKNTGAGCHFPLQCKKVKTENEFAQSCPTLSNPMDCSLLGSSIHGIFQARVLKQGAIAFSSVPLRLSKYELLVETANSEVRWGKEAPPPNSIPSVTQIIKQWHLIN